jgi:hypothetical protein
MTEKSQSSFIYNIRSVTVQRAQPYGCYLTIEYESIRLVITSANIANAFNRFDYLTTSLCNYILTHTCCKTKYHIN